jgi:hypothetical protein
VDRKSVAAGAIGAVGSLGLSGSLLMWLVNQQAVTEAAHAEMHRQQAIQIAKIEARLDYHHGEPTPPEAEEVEAAAEASVKGTAP